MINRARINKENKVGSPLIHFATKNHHIEQLTLLKKSKADFKGDDETPLLLVCKHMPTFRVYTLEEIKIIDLLTHKSCDINVPDKKGYSPLHYAARLCSGRVIERLIRSGAAVNCQSNSLQLAPLHCAMQCSRLDAVDALMRHGAKVNPVAVDGITPLHLAVASSSVRIVKYLIDLGAKMNYRESSYFFSPMHVALLKRRRDMLELLASSGADANVASRNGVTCLHLASMIGDVEIVDRLIQSGADVNCREKNQSMTPIHVALSRGKALQIVLDESSLFTKFLRSSYPTARSNYKAVFFSLLKNGADVKSTTRTGKNAFHLTFEASVTDTDIIEVLLDSEIDVNAKERDTQSTPLLVASREGLDEAIEKLVKVSADVNAVSKSGKSSLHFAIEFCNDWLRVVKLLLRYGADVNCKDQNYVTPLHTAARHEGRKGVITKLIDAEADVHALTKDGRSTLHCAAESGDADNVKILMERGVDVKQKESIFQYTALHLAVNKTCVKVIEGLVHGGVDVNAKDASGKTALHLATCYQDKMVEVLVKCGAYVDVQDNGGRTPLHYAIEHDNADGLMVLIRSGASINDILLCREFRVDRVFSKKDVRQCVLRHLMELKALGFPTANVYEQYITRTDLQSVYYKNCINEVVMLKAHLLSIKVSLYDFLHMDLDSRFAHTKSMMSSDLESKFRIYKNVIQNSYRETVDRKPLLEPTRLALNWLVNIDLPVSCTKRIFSYLKSWHLKTIIAAVQNEKYVRELLKTKVCSVQ